MSDAAAKKGSAISAWLQKQDFLKKHSLLRKQGLKLLAVGITLILLTVAIVIHQQAQEDLLAANNRYQQQQNTNRDAAQAAAVLNQYLGVYRALQAQGIIQETQGFQQAQHLQQSQPLQQPQRLQWLEALLAGVNRYWVPKVSFVLSRTEAASTTNTTYMHDTVPMKVTPMRIEFTLLHEGDFDRLVRTLRAEAKGVFSLESCEIQRAEETGAGNADETMGPQGDFKGQCELLWYSLADITSAWEVPQ